MKLNSSNMCRVAITALSILLSAAGAYAAPGTLSNTPMFVSTSVDPNLFMITDDSGSMWWGQVFQEGVGDITTVEGLPELNGMLRRYWHPQWMPEVVPPAGYQDPDTSATWDDALWLLRNHNANKLYYNPDVDYHPWPGKDSSGNALYKDANPKKAQRHPQWDDPETVNLTKKLDYVDVDKDGCDDDDAYKDTNCVLKNSYFIPSYYTWTDDGNGIIEVSDKHTLIEIKPSTKSYPSGRTYKEELQNFANWFQYHRKREFAAKAAIGSVIENAEATRIGFYAFNAGLLQDAKSMAIAENKTNLLKSVYAVKSQKRTPARNALYRVGQQFQKTSSSAPILPASEGGECQQNFAILMSDGFYNQEVKASFGNADKSETADNGFDGDQTESIDGGNYEDDHSETLADIAMYFYENDLRTDLGNKVPTKEGVDLADHQHLVLYTVSFGLKGSLDPTEDDPLDEGFEWPSPWTDEIHKVDDMWHAAYNGRGEYLSADNTEELKAALNEAVADIAERTAMASAAAVTTARLTTDSVIYLSEFNTNRWQGNLYAYTITEENSSFSLSRSWNAGTKLNTMTNPQTTRQIITYDRSSDGVAFQWDSISDDMKDDLKTNAQGGTDSDEIGEARLNYLRGDRSNEGQGLEFRPRASLLGDIVYSAPVYVSEPAVGWSDEAPFPTAENLTYSDFVAAHSDDPDTTANEARDGVIYVGANDGMLHAFNASDGSELFGYIPSYLASDDSSSGLHYLTEQDYIHKFYNDLSPTVSDVFLDTGNGDGTGWHTILIGGQRAGGRGYFALDITNPANLNEANAANMAMWEFSYLDDADLGYTFSRPQIGLANNGKWVAIFGNGYNGTGDGKAKLFIANIEGPGSDKKWDSSNYTELSTGAGSTDNLNGLSSPQLVDLDRNGTVDRVYAGDLFGNLWAFDLSGATTGSWEVAYSGSPLFTTIGNRPITTRPAVSFHPTESTTDSTEPNIMLTFGSGQYIVDADKNINDSTPAEYFYGVWDEGSSGLDSDDLVEQTFVSGVTDSDGNAVRVLTSNEVDYRLKNGWYIKLPDAGERQITNSTIRSGTVFFNTSVPENSPCSTGGYGYRFTVDLATGGALSEPVIDYNGDGEVGDEGDFVGDDGDVIPSAGGLEGLPPEDSLTENFIINRTDLTRLEDAPVRQTGRISWQELLR